MSAPRAWLIRAGRGGERENWCVDAGFSGGGFHEVEDLSPHNTREAVRSAVSRGFAGDKEGRINNFAAQLWALRGRMSVGDLVALPLKHSPQIALGRITGDYQYLIDQPNDRRHVRPVEWLLSDLPRTAIRQDLLYSLGAFSTICEMRRNDAARRLFTLSATKVDPGASAEAAQSPGEMATDDLTDETVAAVDIQQTALDQIQQRIIETFAGHRMQDLVAAILTVDGFLCTTSPPGADGGVDILAGRGPLGLDEPRLVVQVKSESGAVGSEVAQQLLGVRSRYDASQGLLVAWGGITRPARQQLSHAYFQVRIWDSADLIRAVLRTYDRLPEAIQAALPLKQVWITAEESG